MSTFASQFKSEIQRVTKKELRVEIQTIKKTNAQHRTDIATLKRRVAAVEATLKKITKFESTPKQVVDAITTVPLRFRVNGFVNLRKKFGFSAAEMGKLLGVSAQSVYHWESGKARPQARQLVSIANARKLSKKAAWTKLSQCN